MVQFQEDKQLKRLDELRRREAEELVQTLAVRHNLPYVDLSKLSINSDALRLVPEEQARAAEVAGFKLTGQELALGVRLPHTELVKQITTDLENKNYRVKLYLTSTASLERAWQRYAEISYASQTAPGVIDISGDNVASLLPNLQTIESLQQILAKEITVAGSGISNLLEVVLAGSIALGASDIHFEPEEQNTRLRYRLDGVLVDIAFCDKKIYHQAAARIKLISGLKLNISKTAQDGRFSIKIKNQDIEIRTSVLPGAYGESIVLRVLNPDAIIVELADLGIEPQLAKIVEQTIFKPNGLILLTGPTGSGKTTTLYAFLRKINSPQSKIITIEDPIEYHLTGINQTQVNRDKKYTFLTGLRAALRQDPDIIMLGEIRDDETAEIAINAALTGHLVLSTLHTNNAAGAIPRLIDLGVNPKIISSALNLTIAQRLVRKLCTNCRQIAQLTTSEKNLVESVLATIAAKRPELNLTATNFYTAGSGCPHCHHSGYLGRTGIFEAIVMDEKIEKIIDQNPNEREIRHAAANQNLLTLLEDGMLKVQRGETDLTELKRVVDMVEH